MKKNKPTAMQRAVRADRRAAVWGGLMLAALLGVLLCALLIKPKDVEIDPSALQYPAAYSFVGGQEVSPSDIEERAENYLEQFREFDRLYCFEYWMTCQDMLSETEGYAQDEQLTQELRGDYEHYLYVKRTEYEKEAALKRRLAACVLCAVGSAAFMGALGTNRILAARLRRIEAAEDSGYYQ